MYSYTPIITFSFIPLLKLKPENNIKYLFAYEIVEKVLDDER